MYIKKYILCALVLIAGCGSAIAQEVKPLVQQAAQLSDSDKRKFDYYFYEAMNTKAQGKYDAAFDLLKYCHQIDSTNANVLYELGDYYNNLDKKNKAMDYYRRAVTYDKENFYYNLAYATLCFEFKQYSDAIEQYEKLLKKNPDNTELYVYLAESYRLDGNYPAAIKALDGLEQVVGLNEKLSILKFQLYSIQKQEGKAFAEIQKYIDKYPAEIRYQILLGNLYLQSGKTKEAFMVYSKAKAIDPEDPYLISSMAEYYEQTDNKAAAENELYTALISPKMDIDTKLGVLAQYVGTLQQNQKDTEAANALFDTLMVQHPQEPKLNLMYGNLLVMQQKKNEARFQYQLFAEANPSNPLGWEQMLSTAFPDSVDLSIKICEEAISYIPDQAQFYFYLGVSQYLKENHEAALTALKKGVEFVDKENLGLLSDFYGQIGDLYYHLEKTDSAFVMYDKALEYNPSNIGILNNYSYFLSTSNTELDKAERMSAVAIKAEPSNPTYLDTYGWVLFMQKAYTMARIYIEKAIENSTERKEVLSAEILEHYGDVLFKTNEPDKALEYWLKAKEAGGSKSKTLERKIETKEYISE